MNEFISIIIVNYNGKKWLKKLFDSLLSQAYKNFEIIFVDNNSSDDSVEFIKNNYKDDRIRIVLSDKNLGFSGGNNLGFKHVKGEYILLLNNDTWAPADYLEKFIKGFQEIPNAGSIQSKIILMSNTDKLDVCGSYWTDSSFLYHYGYGQDQSLEKYNRVMPFFSNKGASMMLRKDVVDKIDFFDEDFWSYYEETDLCNRIWLAGYECWYYPKAVVYHAMGGTSLTFPNSEIQFHNFKNKLLSFLKNFEIWTLAGVFPVYFVLNMALSFFWLLQGEGKKFWAFYRAIWWNILHFRQTLRKRMIIQSFRKKKDGEFFKKVKRNPRLKYYYYLLTGLEKYGE
jgi:GT2 family glycosyltransferase